METDINETEVPQECYCKRVPLWKWALLFVGTTALFFFLYGLCQSVCFSGISPLWKCILCLVLSDVMLAVYMQVIGRIEGREIRQKDVEELLPKKSFPEISKGVLIGILFFAIVAGVLIIGGWYKVMQVNFNWRYLLVMLTQFLLVAVSEEIIFRGIIFRMIWQRWGVVAALLVSSLLFGFIHIMNPSGTVWSSVAIAVEAGLLLGAAYVYSGRLWLPIGIHWAWNFVEGPLLGMNVSGAMPGDSLVVPSISGPEILTGGSFGPEASLISLIVGVALSAYMLYSRYGKGKSAPGEA